MGIIALRAAVAAGIQEIPCDVRQGTREKHRESICLDNMKFDVSSGTIGQMYSTKEKRGAIKSLLLIPSWWQRSDGLIADKFKVARNSVTSYRTSLVAQIEQPDNLPLSQDEYRLLCDTILKRQRFGKDGKSTNS